MPNYDWQQGKQSDKLDIIRIAQFRFVSFRFPFFFCFQFTNKRNEKTEIKLPKDTAPKGKWKQYHDEYDDEYDDVEGDADADGDVSDDKQEKRIQENATNLLGSYS